MKSRPKETEAQRITRNVTERLNGRTPWYATLVRVDGSETKPQNIGYTRPFDASLTFPDVKPSYCVAHARLYGPNTIEDFPLTFTSQTLTYMYATISFKK